MCPRFCVAEVCKTVAARYSRSSVQRECHVAEWLPSRDDSTTAKPAPGLINGVDRFGTVRNGKYAFSENGSQFPEFVDRFRQVPPILLALASYAGGGRIDFEET